MGEEQGFFQPTEMEVDRSSKLSLLEHISYRLRLPDRLDHSDNGHLDGGQMLELTKAVISESEGYDPKNSKAMKEHLKHLYQKVLDQKEVRLTFITSKKIDCFKYPVPNHAACSERRRASFVRCWWPSEELQP